MGAHSPLSRPPPRRRRRRPVAPTRSRQPVGLAYDLAAADADLAGLEHDLGAPSAKRKAKLRERYSRAYKRLARCARQLNRGQGRIPPGAYLRIGTGDGPFRHALEHERRMQSRARQCFRLARRLGRVHQRLRRKGVAVPRHQHWKRVAANLRRGGLCLTSSGRKVKDELAGADELGQAIALAELAMGEIERGLGSSSPQRESVAARRFLTRTTAVNKCLWQVENKVPDPWPTAAMTRFPWAKDGVFAHLTSKRRRYRAQLRKCHRLAARWHRASDRLRRKDPQGYRTHRKVRRMLQSNIRAFTQRGLCMWKGKGRT